MKEGDTTASVELNTSGIWGEGAAAAVWINRLCSYALVQDDKRGHFSTLIVK